jgi:hypothetical protein
MFYFSRSAYNQFFIYYSQPDFVCSRRRALALEAHLNTMKFPSSWERLRNVLSDATGMKIAEALQCLGDFGAYVIGLTDIAAPYKTCWIRLFRDVCGSFLVEDTNLSPFPVLSLDECQTQMVPCLLHVLYGFFTFCKDSGRFVCYFL